MYEQRSSSGGFGHKGFNPRVDMRTTPRLTATESLPLYFAGTCDNHGATVQTTRWSSNVPKSIVADPARDHGSSSASHASGIRRSPSAVGDALHCPRPDYETRLSPADPSHATNAGHPVQRQIVTLAHRYGVLAPATCTLQFLRVPWAWCRVIGSDKARCDEAWPSEGRLIVLASWKPRSVSTPGAHSVTFTGSRWRSLVPPRPVGSLGVVSCVRDTVRHGTVFPEGRGRHARGMGHDNPPCDDAPSIRATH